MKTFTLNLISPDAHDIITNVVSFTGSDHSGKFGIMAGHARMITILQFGIATIKLIEGFEYLAVSEGELYFVNNQLNISTRKYLRSKNYTELAIKLLKKLTKTVKDVHESKQILNKLDEDVLKRIKKYKEDN